MRRIGLGLVSLAVFLVIWKLVTVVGDFPGLHPPTPGAGWSIAACGGSMRASSGSTSPRHAARGVVLGFALGATTGISPVSALSPRSIVRAGALAAHRRGPCDPDPRARPAAGHLVRRRPGLRQVLVCALIVFFPIAIATMGRGPLDRSALDRDAQQPRRHSGPAHAAARDPIGTAGHLRRPAGRGDLARHRCRRRRVDGSRRPGSESKLINIANEDSSTPRSCSSRSPASLDHRPHLFYGAGDLAERRLVIR